ncbi:putative phospholipase B-like 2 isoform X3 [Papilio machaon]|uniref:putative phospholipase B-like 2 isoform X3 n=1 Tax=Papilio machaon TaxID=76193 RepID=UPI001E6652FE|nr:putative phospholipase B-like 2 isoform X3 [Papilio machaon]
MKIYWRCCLLLITTVSMYETKYGYVTWKKNKLTFKECKSSSQIPISYGARATFRNEINSTGWAFLEVHTSKDVTDEQQAYAAGFIEGYLTRDLIWMHWQNMLKGYCYNKTDLCGLIEEFIEKNENYIASMVFLNEIDPYWYQVKLYYIQLEGLAVGYNQATSDPYQWLTARDMVWINMLGDLDDLALSLALPKNLPDGLLFGDHCTGLIKLLPDFKNLYTAHATWNSYQSMLRLQKMYVLHYKVSPLDKKRIPGYKMAFTSYPAFVQTTSTSYLRAWSPGRPPSATVTRPSLASSIHYVYIVDYNKFTPSSKVCKGKAEKGLLWVIEQLPGYTEAADLTEQLVNTTYFPSYNIPYFPTIFNLSGGNVRVATFGDWFGYKTNPRANILKEKQAGITNLRDMFNTMRYNDFKHDPLSRCACVPPYSACNAIAARNDLNPANGTFPFRALGHRSHGGTDAKVTSWQLRKNYEFVAVSGPTFNISRGIPPFVWSEFDMGANLPHIGHPDVWAFKPIIHHWEWT